MLSPKSIYSDRELLMFHVMDALYNGGVPISFKGSMVLKAFLEKQNYGTAIRETKDIDGNWLEGLPSIEQIKDSFQKAFDRADINLRVEAFRNYGEGKSAGFKFFDTTDPDNSEPIFTMDLDVGRVLPAVQMYQVDNFSFTGLIPEQMLADKISVLSTQKVFRRAKDVLDLYYMSKCLSFEPDKVRNCMIKSGRVLEDFSGFIDRKEDLRHAYDKYKFKNEDMTKPDFDTVYEAVKTFVSPFLPERKVDLAHQTFPKPDALDKTDSSKSAIFNRFIEMPLPGRDDR